MKAVIEIETAHLAEVSPPALKFAVRVLVRGSSRITRAELISLAGASRASFYRYRAALRKAGILKLEWDRDAQKYIRSIPGGVVAKVLKGPAQQAYPKFDMCALKVLRENYTGPPAEFLRRVEEALLSAARSEQKWDFLLKWVISRINMTKKQKTGKNKTGNFREPRKKKT